MGKKKKVSLDLVLKDKIQPKAAEIKDSLCSAQFIISAVKTLCLILLYYIFSIGLTFYNQRFIHHFQIPLSFTLAHFVIKFMLSVLIRTLVECRTKKERITLSWKLYLTKIAPTGIASVMDISLSNWSFEFITVSLYTMTKSTAVIFILGFSIIFRLEKARWSLILIVLFISGGLFMFTYHSTQFNLEGFIMVLSAAVLAGLRWSLAQIVTQKKEIGLENPLDMMYHIQPWMIIGLIPLSAIFEGIPLATTKEFFRFQDLRTISSNLSLVFGGAVIAFMLEFSEFLILASTSSLTLSISSIFKEVCTLYLAAKVNNDKMNLVNGIGLVVCLMGITLHVILKAVYRKNHSRNGAINREEAIEMLKSDVLENSDGEIISDEDEIFNAGRDRR